MAYATCRCEPSLCDRSVWPPVARTVSSTLIVPQRSRFMLPNYIRRFGLSLAAIILIIVPLAAAEPRPIEIHVDATDAPRKLYRAKLTIPAKPGPLTLYYPKWIQGEHQPSGPIIDLAGLKLTAAGKPVAWKRDDVDLYAFHC